VILLRRGGRHNDRGLELLLLKRGAEARFMPGVWVFAGGTVDDADLEAARASAPGGVAAEEWAHRICSARETSEEAGLEVDPANFLPWSRWITPTAVPVRFDTRFYVGLAPAHAKPEPDRVEMDEARWFGAGEALRAAESAEIELSFPTIRHLEELERFASADDVLAAAADRKVEPILPRVVASDDSFDVLLPGDPGYDG